MFVKMNKKAFTLVELMIATAVSTIFIIAAFSLYNMSSKMFNAGSWRQNAQKQAERLLSVLSADIAKASIPIIVPKTGLPEEGRAYLYYRKTPYIVALGEAVNATTELISFPICSAAYGDTQGAIIENTLVATNGVVNGGCKLKYISVDLNNHDKLPDVIKAKFADASGKNESKFKATAVSLGMGSGYSVTELDYVSKVTVKVSEKDKNGRVVNISVECVYPKHPETKFTVSTAAALDVGIEIE